MNKTLQQLNNIKISCEITSNGSMVCATVGDSKCTKVEICDRYYAITIHKNDRAIVSTFDHTKNLIEAILECNKKASMYL